MRGAGARVRLVRALACSLLAALSLSPACGDPDDPAMDAEADGEGGGKSDDVDPPPAHDPFAPLPDESEGLTNTSDDVEALLEHGALSTACQQYAASPGDRRLELLCGKAMFFYESYGTPGVPERLLHFFAANFPDEIGIGYERYGMIRDPFSDRELPIGFGPSTPIGPLSVDTVAFTCASCHVGRLPDGRIAVGAPNHDYDYGKQILSLILVPSLALPGASEEDHAPEAVAAVQPIRDRLRGDFVLMAKFVSAVVPLIGQAQLSIRPDSERYYARWKPGTMDFVIDPLPADDHVHTISKISAIWSIPRPTEVAAHGMPNAMLGWNGSMASVERFVEEFVALGGGDVAAWPPERLKPLAEYVYSLRPPTAPAGDPAAIERGKQRFTDSGCLDCHGGPRGSGVRLYAFDEVGTDRALERWADPELTGEACCGIDDPAGEYVTHAIKSPRLAGGWVPQRFLHNGAVESLEALLCLEPREGVSEAAFGDGGHELGCDLPEPDRRDLIAYLRSI